MDKQTQKNLLDLVKHNYEEIAVDFDTTRQKYLWPELIKLTESVKDGDKILDAGCGNGRLLEAFGEKKIEYLGVDNSEKLIEAANKNFQFSKKFLVADILELDKIPENNFDYIFCIAVLHHLPGDNLHLKALKRMKNKLRPNGKIIITVWNLWSRRKFLRLIFKTELLKLFKKLIIMSRRLSRSKHRDCGRDPDFALRTSGDFGDIIFNWKNNKGEQVSQRYYHAFTKNELKKLAIGAGFKIEKLSKDKYNYYLVLER